MSLFLYLKGSHVAAVICSYYVQVKKGNFMKWKLSSKVILYQHVQKDRDETAPEWLLQRELAEYTWKTLDWISLKNITIKTTKSPL